MIGDGSLLGPCNRLVQALHLEESVTLLGALCAEDVASEMKNVRAFVQHPVGGEDGGSEGTSVAVIEAQMSGLPVIATNHGGIPDVVADGKTGFHVAEGDIDKTAVFMAAIVNNPILAKMQGDAGRERARAHFTINHHIDNLTKIIVA